MEIANSQSFLLGSFILCLLLTSGAFSRLGGMSGENMNKCLTRIGSLEESIAKLDMCVGGLEVVIEEGFKHFEKHLEKMESSLTVKLDKIDEDIRRNGKVSINVRLDRLEKLKYLVFGVIGVLATPLVAGWIDPYFSLVEKLIGK